MAVDARIKNKQKKRINMLTWKNKNKNNQKKKKSQVEKFVFFKWYEQIQTTQRCIEKPAAKRNK